MYDFDLNPELDRSWVELRNCADADTNLFFPERGQSTAAAKKICRSCVVREECLNYAMMNGEKVGIWGGLSELERRRIRSARWQARLEAQEATC